MTFYERLEELCKANGLKPQNKDFLAFIGVASGTVTNWKQKGAQPEKIETYIKISEFFGVTLDYLVKENEGISQQAEMTRDEAALLQKYRNLDLDGKAEVIHVANVQLQRMEKITSDEQNKSTQRKTKTGTLD